MKTRCPCQMRGAVLVCSLRCGTERAVRVSRLLITIADGAGAVGCGMLDTKQQEDRVTECKDRRVNRREASGTKTCAGKRTRSTVRRRVSKIRTCAYRRITTYALIARGRLSDLEPRA